MSPLCRALRSPSSLISPLLSHSLLPAQKTLAFCSQRSEEVEGKPCSRGLLFSFHLTKRMARRSHVTDFQFFTVHFQTCEPHWELVRYRSVPASSCSPEESWLERDLLQIMLSGELPLSSVRVLEFRNSSRKKKHLFPLAAPDRLRVSCHQAGGGWSGVLSGTCSQADHWADRSLLTTSQMLNQRRSLCYFFKLIAFLHLLTQPRQHRSRTNAGSMQRRTWFWGELGRGEASTSCSSPHTGRLALLLTV